MQWRIVGIIVHVHCVCILCIAPIHFVCVCGETLKRLFTIRGLHEVTMSNKGE